MEGIPTGVVTLLIWDDGVTVSFRFRLIVIGGCGKKEARCSQKNGYDRSLLEHVMSSVDMRIVG